jgi:hypothetical protein
VAIHWEQVSRYASVNQLPSDSFAHAEANETSKLRQLNAVDNNEKQFSL